VEGFEMLKIREAEEEKEETSGDNEEVDIEKHEVLTGNTDQEEEEELAEEKFDELVEAKLKMKIDEETIGMTMREKENLSIERELNRSSTNDIAKMKEERLSRKQKRIERRARKQVRFDTRGNRNSFGIGEIRAPVEVVFSAEEEETSGTCDEEEGFTRVLERREAAEEMSSNNDVLSLGLEIDTEQLEIMTGNTDQEVEEDEMVDEIVQHREERGIVIREEGYLPTHGEHQLRTDDIEKEQRRIRKLDRFDRRARKQSRAELRWKNQNVILVEGKKEQEELLVTEKDPNPSPNPNPNPFGLGLGLGLDMVDFNSDNEGSMTEQMDFIDRESKKTGDEINNGNLEMNSNRILNGKRKRKDK
jgi:hypothetical protein